MLSCILFYRCGAMQDKIITPLKDGEQSTDDEELAMLQKVWHDAVTSLRQAAEWGMRALQGSFARLRVKMSSDAVERKELILSIMLLHNFRTHNMGINQINAVFSPEYEAFINDQSYDRIARYYARAV